MKSFLHLYQWIMGSSHRPVGGPRRIIVYGVDESGLPQTAGLQVPVQ